MKPMQYNSTTAQGSQEADIGSSQSLPQRLSNLKIAARNCWFLLGNVLLLIGGDDSVELCLASLALELTNHNSRASSAIIAKDSCA